MTDNSTVGVPPSGAPAVIGGQGDRAYEGLLDLLVSREIAPGDVLTERRLAVRLGLSRTPMREALHRLEGERILERRTDGKLYVRKLTVEDVMEALHVRRLLEAEAASRSAGRIPAETLADLRARLVRLREGADPTVPDHRNTDEDLHSLIGQYGGNQLLADMIKDLRQRTRMFSMKRLPERLPPICEEHIAIVDALGSGDGARAAAAVVAHLENVKLSILTKLAEL